MLIKKIVSVGAGAILVFVVAQAFATATPEQAERLGKSLTPMGAERAGNASGTIPRWTDGITTPPPGYKPGDHHPDPFPNDQVLFTITGANANQHKDRLSPGQLALLKTYPDYKMPVYKTRRTASYPQRIYDAVKANATRARIVANGNGVADTIVGVPFPIPKLGVEVIWNHILRYRGNAAARYISQAAPTRTGNYTLVKFEDEFDFIYTHPNATFEGLHNRILYFKQKVLAPARLAGFILVVHETLNQVKEPRSAWTYNTGQRRVRRAPNVAYDNPGTAADNQRTSDQFDMYNGAPDRYDWKLVGKQELYVPYNSYKLHSDKLKYTDILRPLHIDQDYTRYELHRVWVVEATLKSGTSHIYKRRTFYIDEDSWQVLIVDQYDKRDKLWRVSEGHVINYYDVPTLWTTLEVHYDLQSGRYLALGLDNEDRMYDFSIKRTAGDYTPSALRREGTR